MAFRLKRRAKKTRSPLANEIKLYSLYVRVPAAIFPDGRTLAVLTTGTYVFHEVEPGQHTLSRLQDVSPIRLDAGHNHFVHFGASLSASGTSFREVSEQEGRTAVSKLPRVITLY